jgi:hypothetical protein
LSIIVERNIQKLLNIRFTNKIIYCTIESDKKSLRNVSPVDKSYGKDGWFVKTFEEQKAFLARMNVIDDQFFQKVVEDREVCEEILRILLQKPDLHVVDYQAQRHLRNIGAHSVILDLLCQDDTGALFNVEVQKADNDDHQKRMRFNISNIDTIFVEKGIDYKDLPDVFAIFLSQFDLFQENRTTYHVHRAITETGTRVENGIHEIYINTAIDDGTAIAVPDQKSVGHNAIFPAQRWRQSVVSQANKTGTLL